MTMLIHWQQNIAFQGHRFGLISIRQCQLELAVCNFELFSAADSVSWKWKSNKLLGTVCTVDVWWSLMFVFVVYAAEPKMAAAPKMNAAFSRERERGSSICSLLQPLVTSRFRAESSILRRASALPWFCSSRRSLISLNFLWVHRNFETATRNDRVWRHWNTIFWTGVGPRVHLQKASWHHEHKRSQEHREYQGKHSIKSFLESFLESFFRVAFCAVKIHSTVQGCAEPSALCSHFLPCTGLEVFLRPNGILTA